MWKGGDSRRPREETGFCLLRGSNKAMSFGKIKVRMLEKNENPITFKNVAGIEESKEELSEIVVKYALSLIVFFDGPFFKFEDPSIDTSHNPLASLNFSSNGKI